jgi:recombination protein RecA
MAKKKDLEEIKDDLTDEINKALKNKFKETKDILKSFETPEEIAATVVDWISTGNDMLDLAISNRRNGGLPVGRIVEFSGQESSGKSLVCAHIIKETQKKGGVGVFIDTEGSTSKEFLQAIGCDISKDKLSLVERQTLEDIFLIIEQIIESHRRNGGNKLVTIVVDSIAGATTMGELEDDYEKSGYATAKAIILSKAMRKITNMIAEKKILLVFTNQVRHKMDAMAFGDKWVTPGGKAIPFHCSIRVRLTNVGNLKNGNDIVGSKVNAKVIKSKIGPSKREVNFDVFFASGLDNYGTWLQILKERKLVSVNGAYYTVKFTAEDGTEYDEKFMAKEFVSLIKEKPAIKDYLYNLLADALIMKYVNTDEVRSDESFTIIPDESDE